MEIHPSLSPQTPAPTNLHSSTMDEDRTEERSNKSARSGVGAQSPVSNGAAPAIEEVLQLINNNDPRRHCSPLIDLIPQDPKHLHTMLAELTASMDVIESKVDQAADDAEGEIRGFVIAPSILVQKTTTGAVVGFMPDTDNIVGMGKSKAIRMYSQAILAEIFQLSELTPMKAAVPAVQWSASGEMTKKQTTICLTANLQPEKARVIKTSMTTPDRLTAIVVDCFRKLQPPLPEQAQVRASLGEKFLLVFLDASEETVRFVKSHCQLENADAGGSLKVAKLHTILMTTIAGEKVEITLSPTRNPKFWTVLRLVNVPRHCTDNATWALKAIKSHAQKDPNGRRETRHLKISNITCLVAASRDNSQTLLVPAADHNTVENLLNKIPARGFSAEPGGTSVLTRIEIDTAQKRQIRQQHYRKQLPKQQHSGQAQMNMDGLKNATGELIINELTATLQLENEGYN